MNNVRTDRKSRQIGQLTPEQVAEAKKDLVRHTQRKEFSEEFRAIRDNKPLPKRSRLFNLMPKTDDDGLLRCDGRLCYAEFLPYDIRFPIILPRGSWITKLIVKHYHELGKHVIGTNHTLANLSTKFWIIAAREEIRAWEADCNECKRRRAKAACQVMAPLPKTRFSLPLRAFSRVWWPFYHCTRKRKEMKETLVMLIHVFMVFLRCLTRTANRRGYPTEILSDRRTNVRWHRSGATTVGYPIREDQDSGTDGDQMAIQCTTGVSLWRGARNYD